MVGPPCYDLWASCITLVTAYEIGQMASNAAMLHLCFFRPPPLSALDLCSPAPLQFAGPWNGSASSPSTFPISTKLKRGLRYFNLSTLIPTKISWDFCEMWSRNEACPTTSPIQSGHRSNSHLRWAYIKVQTVDVTGLMNTQSCYWMNYNLIFYSRLRWWYD